MRCRGEAIVKQKEILTYARNGTTMGFVSLTQKQVNESCIIEERTTMNENGTQLVWKFSQ